MPISAVTIGRPIATTEPNATSSTMIATPTPISSLLGVFCRELGELAGELDVCTPPARAASATAVASSSCVGGELVDRVGDVDVRRLPVGADGGGLRARTGR